MPDTRSSAEALLGDVERQLDLVDTGLMTGEPTALQSACGDLRRVAVAFAGVLEAALSAEAFDLGFRRRVEAVAQRLSTQRESLARRNVVVERALASIMRPSGSATYSVGGERGAFGGGRAMGVH